jgi:hypothetical protein
MRMSPWCCFRHCGASGTAVVEGTEGGGSTWFRLGALAPLGRCRLALAARLAFARCATPRVVRAHALRAVLATCACANDGSLGARRSRFTGPQPALVPAGWASGFDRCVARCSHPQCPPPPPPPPPHAPPPPYLQGDWVFGKRHGQGTYYYLDGGKYEGEVRPTVYGRRR